ncbi:hypothetical protein B0O80DRAFT_429145 [Mortierella sp. GBAus27b]|nr:hypothetical protein B0O80DRAFT_429145 [Mortierella sp. GBAus27b]
MSSLDFGDKNKPTPIHFIEVRLYIESLFCLQDWTEIKSNLPHSATYSTETVAYLDTLAGVVLDQDIIRVLDCRPRGPEKAIEHHGVENCETLNTGSQVEDILFKATPKRQLKVTLQASATIKYECE